MISEILDLERVQTADGTVKLTEGKKKIKVSNTYTVVRRKVVTPLLELTCHIGSHSVTCHPAEVTFQPLPPAEAGT